LGSHPLRIAKRLTNRPDIGAQPSGTDQEWTMQRAPTHPLDETTNKRQVTVGAHSSGEPQAGTYPQPPSPPNKAPLRLYAGLLRFHLPPTPPGLGHMVLGPLPLANSARPPTPPP